MKYEYKTLSLRTLEDRQELNRYYSEGWQFVNSVAANITGKGTSSAAETAHVYFTIRKKLDL